mgnify:CR=1 FL=1
MKFIDANIVLRYLIGDPEAGAIEKLLKGKEKLILSDIIVAEIVWSLMSFYKWGKERTTSLLASLIRLDGIRADKNLLLRALKLYKIYNVDYIDAYLCAVMGKNKVTTIYSYDRHYNKFPGIHRLEPR